MRKLPMILLTTLLLIGAATTAQTENTENAIITVRFKAQPDKGEEAAAAINKLLEQVQ